MSSSTSSSRGTRTPRQVFFHGGLSYLIGPKDKLEATQAILKNLSGDEVVRIAAETRAPRGAQPAVLVAKITNVSDRTLVGVVDVGALTGPKINFRPQTVRRRHWTGAKPVGPIAPGETAKVEFELNAYETDSPMPRGATVLFTFDGISAGKTIENVLKAGAH